LQWESDTTSSLSLTYKNIYNYLPLSKNVKEKKQQIKFVVNKLYAQSIVILTKSTEPHHFCVLSMLILRDTLWQ